jgi:hypothetical protein
MILIYGTGTYGKIDLHAGQYAATRFFHLYWMPLFPVSTTVWIQSDEDEHYRGHLTRWSWKSVLSAYARTWGVAVGAILLLSSLDSLGWSLLSVLLLGASLSSWRWRSLPSKDVHKRELFASVTGTYCDPDYLRDDMLSSLQQQLESLWEKNFSSQTPNDIARYGTKDPSQAALAYSIVRLLASEAENPKRLELLATADAIANGTPQETLPQENPYRVAVVSSQ